MKEAAVEEVEEEDGDEEDEQTLQHREAQPAKGICNCCAFFLPPFTKDTQAYVTLRGVSPSELPNRKKKEILEIDLVNKWVGSGGPKLI